MAAGNYDWLFVLLGLALAAGAMALLSWALFRDRSRGRRRCPKCWYDMSGTPGKRCPECGREARRERAFFRTRRRWRRAALGVPMLALAYLSFKVPELRNGGWTALVPSTALILVAPATNPSAGMPVQTAGLPAIPAIASRLGVAPAPAQPPTIGESLEAAAWGRISRGRMWRWQSQYFIGRYLRASDTDLADWVNLPVHWIAGERVPFLYRAEHGLPLPFGSFTVGGATIANQPYGMSSDSRTPFLLGAFPVCESIPLTLEMGAGGRTIYRTRISAPISIRPDAASLFDPVDTPDDNAMVRVALDPRIVVRPGGAVVVCGDRSKYEPWPSIDYGIGYALEVVLDGRVVARADKGGLTTWDRPVWMDWEEVAVMWEPGALERVLASPGSAKFVVRGEPMMAFESYRSWPFNKPRPAAWSGSFECPVRVAREEGTRGEHEDPR